MTAATGALVATAILTMGPARAEEPQPYAGLEGRPIKALSAEQVDDYRNGRGMGLALAAELNGYPGPRHVLDLAGPLALTPEQRDQAQALFDAMRAEAVELGERIVVREEELDRLFAHGAATPEAVETLAVSIGELNGALRSTHLRYHLATRDLLTADQIEAYQSARGYRSPDHGRHGGGH